MADLGTRGVRHLGAQSRAVAVWKVAEYAGLILFTLIMPRRMGPTLYGTFAALLSLIGLLTLASGIGAQSTFGRFVPEYEARGQQARTRALFTQLFALRLVGAGGLAVVLALVFRRLLPGASLTMALAGTGAFLSVALSSVSFHLLYGLNRLGRSLAHDSLIKLVLVGLVLALGGQHDADRAAIALFVAEFGFLWLGLVWTRAYFAPAEALDHRDHLRGPLRFGLSLFGTNMLLLSVWRGGELVVLYLSGNQAEVAYYSVANAAAMAFAALMSQLIVLLVPSLTALHVSGRSESMEDVLGIALKYLTISALLVLLLIYGFGEWLVNVALGDSYTPVIANLRNFSVGLLAVPLIRVCLAIAVIRKETRKALIMAASGVVAFLALSAVLVPSSGSLGASTAAAVAVLITGVLGALEFSLWPLLRTLRFGRLFACGAMATVVVLVPYGPGPLMGAAAAIVFVASLFASGVVEMAEIRRLAKAFVT